MRTKSICPECEKVIPAEIDKREDGVFLVKECEKHGKFEEKFWGDADSYDRYMRYSAEGYKADTTTNCPNDCGLCAEHVTQQPFFCFLNLTSRCNANCPTCFQKDFPEPTFEELRKMFKAVLNAGCSSILYTGGEPTVRKDLVEVVKLARECGIRHQKLSTNGILLAEKPGLARELKESGLGIVLLSFDSLDDEIYKKMKGQPLLETKKRALENCRRAGLEVVLIPTVMKGVNDSQLGAILDFAARNSDIVKMVDFQAMFFEGRYPKVERITAPEIVEKIAEQTPFRKEFFYPLTFGDTFAQLAEYKRGKRLRRFAEHPLCTAFSAFYSDKGRIVPFNEFIDLARMEKEIRLFLDSPTRLNYARFAYRVLKAIDWRKKPRGFKLFKLLRTFHKIPLQFRLGENAIVVSVLNFMDRYTLDTNRLKGCTTPYILPSGKLVPFCAYNVLRDHY